MPKKSEKKAIEKTIEKPDKKPVKKKVRQNETNRDALRNTESSASCIEKVQNETNETNETIVDENEEEGENETNVEINDKILYDETDKTKEAKYWCFTFNNYNKANIGQLENIFKHECEWYIFQEETGEESGIRHLQGICYFKKKKRLTALKKYNKAPHWRITRSVTASIAYCTKQETRTGDIYSYNVDIPEDIEIEEPYGWQLQVLDIINTKPDKRTIHWFWEPNGKMGKTTLCKYLFVKHKALFLSGKSNDMFHIIAKAKNRKVMIINIPRVSKGYINVSALESIKDGFICSGKYESCNIAFNCPHVIVFANEPPKTELMSKDRWHIVRIGEESTNEKIINKIEYDCDVDDLERGLLVENLPSVASTATPSTRSARHSPLETVVSS